MRQVNQPLAAIAILMVALILGDCQTLPPLPNAVPPADSPSVGYPSPYPIDVPKLAGQTLERILPWFISEEDLTVEVPDLVEKEGNYTVEITRQFASDEEAALLRRAEAIYPNRGKVIAAIRAAHFQLRATPGESEPLWWYSDFDGVRIPYAITARSVHYYLDLTRAFRRGDFSGSATIRMLRSRLKYTATIKHHDEFTYEHQWWLPIRSEFRDVYVATLELGWVQSCGSLCAMGFEVMRVIVLDPAGSVLAVFGDGGDEAKTALWVS